MVFVSFLTQTKFHTHAFTCTDIFIPSFPKKQHVYKILSTERFFTSWYALVSMPQWRGFTSLLLIVTWLSSMEGAPVYSTTPYWGMWSCIVLQCAAPPGTIFWYFYKCAIGRAAWNWGCWVKVWMHLWFCYLLPDSLSRGLCHFAFSLLWVWVFPTSLSSKAHC